MPETDQITVISAHVRTYFRLPSNISTLSFPHITEDVKVLDAGVK